MFNHPDPVSVDELIKFVGDNHKYLHRIGAEHSFSNDLLMVLTIYDDPDQDPEQRRAQLEILQNDLERGAFYQQLCNFFERTYPPAATQQAPAMKDLAEEWVEVYTAAEGESGGREMPRSAAAPAPVPTFKSAVPVPVPVSPFTLAAPISAPTSAAVDAMQGLARRVSDPWAPRTVPRPTTPPLPPPLSLGDIVSAFLAGSPPVMSPLSVTPSSPITPPPPMVFSPDDIWRRSPNPPAGAGAAGAMEVSAIDSPLVGKIKKIIAENTSDELQMLITYMEIFDFPYPDLATYLVDYLRTRASEPEVADMTLVAIVTSLLPEQLTKLEAGINAVTEPGQRSAIFAVMIGDTPAPSA
jgi:hypothetical protein